MPEMTPETLRALIGRSDDNEGSDAVQADMRDCASAWEVNLETLKNARELNILRAHYLGVAQARIEALTDERDELLCGLVNRGNDAERRLAALAAGVGLAHTPKEER